MFVDICVPAVLEDVQRLLDWKPDVIIREEGEFSAPVVAELAGVPCAEHSWGPVRPRQQRESAVAALTPIWLAHGLAPDPMCGIHRSLYFDICPPSLQFDEEADIRVARLLQPTTPQFDVADVPAWAHALGDRPVIYVTLGTVPRYNSDSDFFQLAADGLAELDADVVITVGPTGDPALVASPAPSVRVERFVPQSAILRHCGVVVTNGGSGSVLGALAFGVPLLCVPAASPSQLRNTEAVLRSAVGRSLDRQAVTAAHLRSDVADLLSDGPYRDAARSVSAEIEAMPSVAHSVGLLEQLVAGTL